MLALSIDRLLQKVSSTETTKKLTLNNLPSFVKYFQKKELLH